MPTKAHYAWLFLTHDKIPIAPFYQKQVKVLPIHERWRETGKALGLGREASLRLEWMIWFESKGEQNAYRTARHFGIAPKTFYAWRKRFDPSNLRSLEDGSTRPKTVRTKEYTPIQYERICDLRRAHIRYSKFKLLVLYRTLYPEDSSISAWKIQCIIQRSNLYYHPQKQARINRKRCRSVRRKKITELKKKKVRGFLLCIDTVVLHWKGSKRYVVTAIDRYSKVAFARMYSTHSSRASEDFLQRLHCLLQGKIQNIQTDNGSEFRGEFERACKELKIEQYVSRVKTPKDNAVNERFNRTIQDEYISMGHMTDNVALFNENLTEWLIEYNFRRPHQSLDYSTPMNFHYKYHKLLPMYPSSTAF